MKVASLFTGAGGLDLGLHQVGIPIEVGPRVEVTLCLSVELPYHGYTFS